LVEGSGPVKHCEKRSVREETVSKTPKQLTAVHVHHRIGVPARDVTVEGGGLSKHCRKKGVREETVFKHITTTY